MFRIYFEEISSRWEPTNLNTLQVMSFHSLSVEEDGLCRGIGAKVKKHFQNAVMCLYFWRKMWNQSLNGSSFEKNRKEKKKKRDWRL